MYHIKKDKRCQQSAALIANGLFQCLKEKEFSQITITDIQKISGVGRSTFYRLFDGMTDVLLFQCDTYFNVIYETCMQKNISSLHEFITQFFIFWMEHIQLLEIISEMNQLDIFYNCHARHFEKIKLNIVEGKIFPETNGKEDYYNSIVSGIMVNILLTWVKRGKRETWEEIQMILRRYLKQIQPYEKEFLNE